MKVQFHSSESTAPDREKGIKVLYAPAKRRVLQWRWYMILLIVCSPLLFFLYKLSLSYILISGPGYISLDKTAVNATASGSIQRIAVSVGDELEENQLIAELENLALDESERLMRAKLDNLKQDAPLQLRSLHGLLVEKVSRFRNVVDYYQRRHEQLLFLRRQGASTIAEIDAARAHLERSRIDLNEARQALLAYEERARNDSAMTPTVLIAERNLRAELENIKAAQQRLDQYSSDAGRVLEIYGQVGETVAQGSPILLLGRSKRPEVIAYLDPKNTDYASKGRAADVILPGGEKLQAIVREDPRLTSRLPANLTSPIGSRNMMLLVKMDFVSLPESYHWVDGLPVTVRFRLF